MRFRAVLVVAVAAATASAQPVPELTKEFQAGVDAFRLGHFDEARTHLEKARNLDPKLPGPHRFLAALAQAQGRWQDCLDESRVALASNPHSSEAADTRKLHSDCRVSAGRPAYHGADLADSAAISVTTNIPRRDGQDRRPDVRRHAARSAPDHARQARDRHRQGGLEAAHV